MTSEHSMAGPAGGRGANRYEEIGRDECLSLLETGRVGRLAVILDGKPVIFPVNYAFHEGAVVFRTNEGSKLTGAGLNRVAFEVDQLDESRRLGWSVVVHGVATEITDALDVRSEELRDLDLHAWAPGVREHWVAIEAESITGRRLVRRTD